MLSLSTGKLISMRSVEGSRRRRKDALANQEMGIVRRRTHGMHRGRFLLRVFSIGSPRLRKWNDRISTSDASDHHRSSLEHCCSPGGIGDEEGGSNREDSKKEI